MSEGLLKNRDIERLRAFAVLFVIVAHISWLQGEIAERIWFFPQPWTGVDLFFVISGFVVSGAFERDIARFSTDGLPVLRALEAFYTKRVARILPTALTALIVWWFGWEFYNISGAWGEATWSGGQVTGLLIANALFFSNYAMVAGTTPGQLGWYWSLCVEEHFYLLYPAFRLVTTTVRQRVRVLASVVILTVFGARMLSDNPKALQQLSHNRFDQLALGVLLFVAWSSWPVVFSHVRARLASNRPLQRRLGWMCLMLLFALATMPTTQVAGAGGLASPTDQLFQMRVGLVVTGALSLILVTLASFDLDILSFGFAPLGRLLVGIGSRSYALYMYHLPVQWIVKEFFLRHPGVLAGSSMPNGRVILIYVVTLVTVVELNYRLIELPFIEWGRRRVARIGRDAPSRENAWRRCLLPIALATVFLGMVGLEFELRSRVEAHDRETRTDNGMTRLITELPLTASGADVVRYLRQHGENGGELLPASTWFLVPDAPLLPLGGTANRPTVLCRGGSGWVTYESDAYGFNNPSTVPVDRVDLALLGDDSVAGACVPPAESIASRLRAESFSVVNLALPGDGALVSLAQLREYGLARKPQLVVWYYSEQSSYSSTSNEMRSLTLMRYLEPGFSQGLQRRFADVNALVERDSDAAWVATNGALPAVTGAAPARFTTRVSWGHWFDFPALKSAWHSRGAVTTSAAANPSAGVFEAAFSMPHAGPQVNGVIPYIAAAVKRASAEVAQTGGRLLFVYLPERRRFTDTATYGDGARSDVLAAIDGAGVPIFDLTPVFEGAGKPLDFFDSGSPLYNVQGMRLVAQATAFAAKRR